MKTHDRTGVGKTIRQIKTVDRQNNIIKAEIALLEKGLRALKSE